MASMTASRLSAGLSDGSRQDDAGRPAGPQPQISPLSVDPAFVASTASSSSSWDGQSSEVAQRPYSAVSPVASPSQEEAAAFGQPASTLPFERPTPPQQSPNPPVAAYLSQSSAEAEPKGYTPLNDMSVSARAALKGKGRAQNQGWVDLERGGEAGSLVDDEEHDMVKDGWDRVEGIETVRSPPTSDLAEYPPVLAMTEEEREEKRIADNLARMHEKEAARRRAARESKYLKSHGPRAGSGSSSIASGASAVGRRNRWSIFGGSDASNPPGGHLPLSYTGSPPPTASPVLSPTSSTYASSSSHAAQPVQHEPMSPTLPSASYQGREWIGGGAQGLQLGASGRRERRRQLGFWENLCGTGRDRRPGDEDDDDSDEDINQGRTNPFE